MPSCRASQAARGLSYHIATTCAALAVQLVFGLPCRWRGARCCYRKPDLLRGGELPAARRYQLMPLPLLCLSTLSCTAAWSPWTGARIECDRRHTLQSRR